MVSVDVVLPVEQVHCAKEVDVGAQRPLAARRTVLVLDHHRRLITDREARLSGAFTPVKVLTIHKEALVQQPDAVNDAAPHQHARAAYTVYLNRQIGIDKGQVVPSETRAVGAQSAQA